MKVKQEKLHRFVSGCLFCLCCIWSCVLRMIDKCMKMWNWKVERGREGTDWNGWINAGQDGTGRRVLGEGNYSNTTLLIDT